jgi:hypothetical protein
VRPAGGAHARHRFGSGPRHRPRATAVPPLCQPLGRLRLVIHAALPGRLPAASRTPSRIRTALARLLPASPAQGLDGGVVCMIDAPCTNAMKPRVVASGSEGTSFRARSVASSGWVERGRRRAAPELTTLNCATRALLPAGLTTTWPSSAQAPAPDPRACSLACSATAALRSHCWFRGPESQRWLRKAAVAEQGRAGGSMMPGSMTPVSRWMRVTPRRAPGPSRVVAAWG